MPTDTSVKFFQNTMSGAPSMGSAAGDFIGVLDACLVTGFGSVTLSSLVISDNVATGTVSTGHNFAMTGATGPVIRIEGATPSALNADWRIQTVPNSTTFTFTTSGISNQTATGTITAKRAPAGFEKVFSTATKAVYRSLDVQGTRHYFRVGDPNEGAPAWTWLRQFETMTDVDTGTNGGSSLYVLKSNYTGNKAWRVYADSRAFWFVGDTHAVSGTLGIGQCFFGDLAFPALPADAGCSGLAGFPAQATNNGTTIPHMTNSDAMRLARSYDGVTTNVAAFRRGHLLNTTVVSNGGADYQAAIGPLVKAVEVFEGTTAFRGLMPGWYGQVHANLWNWLAAYYEHPQIGTLRGDQLYCNGDYNQFFDITGPWR